MEHKLVKGTQGEALQVPKGRKRGKRNLSSWKFRKLERIAEMESSQEIGVNSLVLN